MTPAEKLIRHAETIALYEGGDCSETAIRARAALYLRQAAHMAEASNVVEFPAPETERRA